MTYKQGWPWGGGGSFFCSVLAYSRKTLHESGRSFFQQDTCGLLLGYVSHLGLLLCAWYSFAKSWPLVYQWTDTHTRKISSRNSVVSDFKVLTRFKQSLLLSSHWKKTKGSSAHRFTRGLIISHHTPNADFATNMFAALIHTMALMALNRFYRILKLVNCRRYFIIKKKTLLMILVSWPYSSLSLPYFLAENRGGGIFEPHEVFFVIKFLVRIFF